jgi:hypothetical protein
LTQSVLPNTPDGLVDLTFDYRFLTPGAELTVKLNDIEVGHIGPFRSVMDELATRTIPLDFAALFGGDTFPGTLLLSFILEGGPGQTVQLDNISFSDFDLVNGDFATGDLTGWDVDTSPDGAALVTNGVDLIFTPEPATATLALLSLSVLVMLLGRHRGSLPNDAEIGV